MTYAAAEGDAGVSFVMSPRRWSMSGKKLSLENSSRRMSTFDGGEEKWTHLPTRETKKKSSEFV